jgi:uncharacterized membrane protein YfcA
MITVPALMYVGLPVHLALGTNKLQSSFGTAMAVLRYRKAGWIDWRMLRRAVFWTLCAAVCGALCVGAMPDALLRKGVPFLLLGVALYMVLAPRFKAKAASPDANSPAEPGPGTPSLGTAEKEASRRAQPGHAVEVQPTQAAQPPPGRDGPEPRLFGFLAGCSLGFYDGFFGPGVGAFWTVAWMGFGLDLSRATAATKVVNLTSNLASLGVFLCAGQTRWDCAGVMIVGQLLGARLGSGLAIRKGARLIRPAFITVVLLLAIRLLMR